ncbi:hypothetical protein [Neobacillus sp. Marseille-QA0830]
MEKKGSIHLESPRSKFILMAGIALRLVLVWLPVTFFIEWIKDHFVIFKGVNVKDIPE